MIRIRKPSNIPSVLCKRGVEKTQELCEKFVQSGGHIRPSAGTCIYDRNIYAHAEVKEVLRQAQHNKCCYCETRVGPGGYLTVEHYRPKGSVRQSKSKKSAKLKPGYYWLAYDWSNLLFCCPACNRNKSDLFPLEDDSRRARSHLDSIDREKPLLVHPAMEDPDKHFYFDGWTIRPLTKRGAKTIDCLILNRPNLQEDRREWLEELDCLLKILMHLEEETQICREEVRQQIESMVQKKYSAFARQLIKQKTGEQEERL